MEKEKNKEIIAFIPARSGSKGIKGKNTVEICGMPLVMWSVFAAAASDKIDRIVVSSNSFDILSLVNFYSRHIHTKVDLLDRREELSLDESTTESVIDDFISNSKDMDDNIVVLMQPTSPFRHDGLIDKVVDGVCNSDFNSCVTVSERSPFFWRMYDEGRSVSPLYCPLSRKRRQDMTLGDLKFQEDGNLYGFTVSGFKRDGHRSPFRSTSVMSDSIHSMEIDTPLDLSMCRVIAQMEIIQRWKSDIVI
jgi:CMP-N-acetylneuraminic acid synthetase